jgi:hypothetical protein
MVDFSLQLSFLHGGGVNAAAGVNLKTYWGIMGSEVGCGVAGERGGGDIGKRVEGGGG